MYELICEIQDEFIWTVLFVEDIHNADSDFLNMLKDLIKQRHIKGAFLLVTAGRDDYTVYNTEFFLLFLNVYKIHQIKQLKIIELNHLKMKNVLI